MPDAVRQEHARDRSGNRLVGAAASDVRLAQQCPGELVGVEVYVAPVDAGVHSGAQRLLHLIEAVDERCEVRVLVRVSAGDVARVAGELRAGVDQERMPLARRVLLQHLVVQHGAARVQRDDGVVRQLLLALPASLEERQLDFEFRGARREGTPGGQVPAGAEPARLAQARQFVGRLDGTCIVQPAHQVPGVDGADAPLGQFRKGIPDVGSAGEVGRQLRACLRAVGGGANLEVSGPVGLRHVRGLVPVVPRSMNDQTRRRPGFEPDKAVRGVLQGDPHLEGGVRLERVGPVVFEDIQERPGMHHQTRVARCRQCARRALAQRLEMRAESALEPGFALGRGSNAGHHSNPPCPGDSAVALTRQ